ncbi:MAG TPA: hypothetical protein VMR86_09775 [Myxococcota bacterium]|nr:hypothetical protein [Myxococcota bacterium]
MTWTRPLALALAVFAASGCIVLRSYQGNELPNVSEGVLVPGTTTKADVLRKVGPPDRLVRQYDGDVFVYAFTRRNVNSLILAEPVFTHTTIFEYTKEQEKSDRLVVMFDRAGLLVSVGVQHGTQSLEPY